MLSIARFYFSIFVSITKNKSKVILVHVEGGYTIINMKTNLSSFEKNGKEFWAVESFKQQLRKYGKSSRGAGEYFIICDLLSARFVTHLFYVT